MSAGPPRTRLCRSTPDDVLVRGVSLPGALIGRVSFTEMLFFQILGDRPTKGQTAVVDACLVALMEHGLTPTAVTARMTYASAPESLQGAVAAGLAGVGSLFVGTVEGCAALLARLVGADDADAEARAVVAEHRAAGRRVPGFGHPVHRPDDPRTPALLGVAREHGVAGVHAAALEALARAVDAAAGKHVTINATGAVAACLSDSGVPPEILRGFAVIARCAGLVGHVREEQLRPAMTTMWHAAEAAVPHEEEDER